MRNQEGGGPWKGRVRNKERGGGGEGVEGHTRVAGGGGGGGTRGEGLENLEEKNR